MVLCAAENCTDYNQIFFFVYFSINKIKTNFMTVKFCLMKNQDYSNSYEEKNLVSIFEKVQINKKPEQMKYYCITFQPRESPIR